MPTLLPSNLVCEVLRDERVNNVQTQECNVTVVYGGTSCACEVCFSRNLTLSPSGWTLKITLAESKFSQRLIRVCSGCLEQEISRILGMGIKITVDERYGSSPVSALFDQLVVSANIRSLLSSNR